VSLSQTPFKLTGFGPRQKFGKCTLYTILARLYQLSPQFAAIVPFFIHWLVSAFCLQDDICHYAYCSDLLGIMDLQVEEVSDCQSSQS
jgi:hypothetical protein